MKKNLSAIIKIAAPLVVLSTQTQIATAADSVRINEAGGLEVSITANRRVQSLDKTLASVSVITRADIEKTQAQDIVDVLRLQRGISISQNGGPGSSTSVFIRGSESDHVLVLLDGVRVSSATTGSFDWAQLPLDQVERIEVVRGPRAALYGSDAIGGVIEITSRKQGSTHVSATVGKYGTKRISAGISGGDKIQFSLNASNERADGFSATNKKAGAFVHNPDKDPFHRDSISIGLASQLSAKIKVGAQLLSSDNKVDYDQGSNDSTLQTVSAYLEDNISDRWSQKFSVSQTRNELEGVSSFGTSNFDTRRSEVNVQNNLSLSDDMSLILGANYREDKGKSNSYDKKIDNKAVYANLNKKFGAFNLDTSLRYDKHSTAGAKTTGQVAAGYEFSSNITAYASYGTAFKAPNINELYYPGFNGSYAGNAKLKPETSKTFEVGVKTQLATNQYLELSAFNTKVSNMISFTGEKQQAVNNEKVTLKGIELGYTGNSGKLDWGVDVSFLNTKNNATGKRLVRRPDHKLTLNLGYALNDQTHLSADASLLGSRSDTDYGSFPSKPAKLEKYSLLNLAVNHKVSKHAAVGLRLENVTDEKYELAHGYNTAGRGAYLTFSYQ